MSIWQNFRKAAAKVEAQVDQWWYALRRDPDATVEVIPYIGFGSTQYARIRGRVLENPRVREANVDDSMWQNLRNFYYRFNSREIPYATVTVHFHGQALELHADEEGFFTAEFTLPDISPDRFWHDVQVQYEDEGRTSHSVGQVVIPPRDASFGVISDLDDTVFISDVIHIPRLVFNVLFKNAHTRLPFLGVAEFYAALQQGRAEDHFNPLFYVSNSPYNLYDLIVHFFEIRNIPPGPIFLRDVGLAERYVVASDTHKFDKISRLLNTYADLPFILIGDSGEHDAEIYLHVIREFPRRIATVYIRDVEPLIPDTKRRRQVRNLAAIAEKEGVEMLLIKDTAVAARHAARQGFISDDALTRVEKAVEAEQAQNPLNRLTD